MIKSTNCQQRVPHSGPDETHSSREMPLLLRAFTRLRSRLIANASHMTGSNAEAEDILQEAFVKLWTAGKQPSTEKDATAILVKTVKNITISEWRRKQVRNEISMDSVPNINLMSDTGEDEAEREELFSNVQRVIHQHLTPTQQKILELREYENLDFDTIALQLGSTPTAVRMQLSRARRIIRECYHQKQGK